MPLSSVNLSDIAKEFAATSDETAETKSAVPNIQEQITAKQDQATRLYIPYNNSNVERVVPYQVERRWLDGTTYTDITQQQIDDAAARTPANIFFPPSWSLSSAKLTANGNSNPTSVSSNSESGVLNATVANQGLISQINLLQNGQSSGVANHVLDTPYSPGASTITLVSGTQTIGNFLYVAGSGTSALVLVTNAVGVTITISEIIPPASTISDIGSSVVENIPGFTNGERQTLTSATYQRILTFLTNRIISAAALWKTSLDNQLTQLNINIDNPSQITAAKASVASAQTAYSTWFALSNTGVSGKFVNTSLANLATSYNSRNSGISTRASQITTALGSVVQDVAGDYSGTGQYLQRFKCLNFLINTVNGPLYQVGQLRNVEANLQRKIANNTDKLTTLSNIARYGVITVDSKGTNIVTVNNATAFAISDSILVTASTLPSLPATITNIVGTNITLNIIIPVTYTKALKSGIIKKV